MSGKRKTIPRATQLKFETLQGRLEAMGRVLVAFSGGVDSSFLLKTAVDVLHQDVLGVTVVSEINPSWELGEAREIARDIGAEHQIVRIDALSNPDIAANSPDRCYSCKKAIFKSLWELARTSGIPYVLDGTNAEDPSDFRPGERALRELRVISPLYDAGLTKKEIRLLSGQMGLSTAQKPSLACLASRFPYHTRIDLETLRKVEGAEKLLRERGFIQVRVRHHGSVARIEIESKRFPDLLKKETRESLSREIKKLGYSYVALDIDGYRTGSLNEPFKKPRR